MIFGGACGQHVEQTAVQGLVHAPDQTGANVPLFQALPHDSDKPFGVGILGGVITQLVGVLLLVLLHTQFADILKERGQLVVLAAVPVRRDLP